MHGVPKLATGIFCMFLGVSLIIQTNLSKLDIVPQRQLKAEVAFSDFAIDEWVNQTLYHKKKVSKSSDSMPFFVGLLSSMALKLTSSIDDVVWLVPFLIVPDRSMVIRNMVIYSWVCLFQTMFALAISTGGIAALDAMNKSSNGWSSEKILSFFAGVSLLAYGAKLFYEWYDENYDFSSTNDEEGSSLLDNDMDDIKSSASALNGHQTSAHDLETSSHHNKDGDDDDDHSSQSKESKKRTAGALFLVSFLGSLDDLTLFVPMLVGQALSWEELVLGSMVAVCIIIMLCIFLGLCKPVANFLESIPLFAIVTVFGTFLTTKALFFTD